MLGISGIANWSTEIFEKMNNVIVVHVDSDCRVKENNSTETTKSSSYVRIEDDIEPGPSTSVTNHVNDFVKALSESDSTESVGLGVNDRRLPPPPPAIDVQALQAAILEDEQRPSSSMSAEGGICYRQCTSYRLDGFLKNPIDLAVGFQLVAVADYDNGVHFVDFKGKVKKHYVSAPYRICGVRLRSNENQVILLAYLEQNWTIMVKKWPEMTDVEAVACPLDPPIMAWARRKITIIGNFLYLLGTCDSCSAIWTLNLTTYTWKTLIVERPTNKKSGVGSTLSSSFRGLTHSADERHSVYSDFDAKQWAENERRILLCELEKSRLNILRINDDDKMISSHSIKVKRKKDQQWIVKGPQLAIYDEKQDIIVYDCSGKIFWFDGGTYRMNKIIGDVGKSEVCALEVDNGWCFALCRHRLCVHAFMYRSE
uniref:Uncharacterized protein n=1 Tax=Panagrolaimus sp. JU765 TaxID=591449 RepID=A0AC34RJH1_9BILA